MTDKNQGDISLYRRLMAYARPRYFAFGLAFIGFLLYASTSALQAELVRQIMLALEAMENQPIVVRLSHPIVYIPLAVIGLFVIRGLGTFLSTYYLDQVARYVIHRLRTDLFRSYQRLPLEYFNSTNSGNLVNRINFNVEQVAAASSSVINNTFREGLTVLATLAYMAYLEWKLTLILLAITPVIAWVVNITSSYFRRYSRRIQQSMGEVTQVSSENIRGQDTVRIYGGSEREITRFDNISMYNMTQALKLTMTRAVSTPIIQLFLSFELAAIIWTAFWLEVSSENLIAFFSAAVAISRPMRSVTQINQDLQKGLAAAEDIFLQLDEPGEPDSGEPLTEGLSGQVSLNNVSFAYPGHHDMVLDDISLNIKAGQSVALVGRSGSGKSTLVSLIPRFYNPVKGSISFDGLSSGDIRLCDLRKQIALVSQQPVLFQGSIRENIAYARPEATDEEIFKAAEQAHVLEFCSQLPEGIDSQIGVDGSQLSGGQRQRVAIARAILKDAPILILDEATSALDNESERLIQDALDHIMQNRTTFIIAHRLSTIEKAELILVVEKGRVVEQGSHQELLAKTDGLYATLHQAQFREV